MQRAKITWNLIRVLLVINLFKSFIVFWDRLQISLLMLSEFMRLINFYSPWNHQKTYGFLMISGGIEVN